MEIEASCGCGAKLKLSPRSAAWNDYSNSERERESVDKAFEKWVQAHMDCRRPEIRYIGGERETREVAAAAMEREHGPQEVA